uniref:Uncharacterized protein n=1 Tax=Oryza brachyantha TaxID=4533 RepID=J3MJI2_ORYBR
MERNIPKSGFPGCIANLWLFGSLLLDDFKGGTNNRPGVRLLGGAAPLLDSLSMNILLVLLPVHGRPCKLGRLQTVVEV